MNFDVDERTILLVKHGSHAYGLNTPQSDIDFKGVCIEPKSYHFGYLHHFEQYERMGNETGGDLKKLASHGGSKADIVIYSLKKFAKLAADCNPNIIEVLHVVDEDVVFADKFGEKLREIADLFISKKARFTFSGYAQAQLKRIKTHRSWLMQPPRSVPDRESFGLSKLSSVTSSELGAFESYVGVSNVSCDDEDAKPDSIIQRYPELPKDLVSLFVREKAYKAAVTGNEQYNHWVKTRNPARAVLEAKFGYDTKHGSHLIRLMRMCAEILKTGKVLVRRPDRDELLAIKNGSISYDELMKQSDALETECVSLYETSPLPRMCDQEKIDSIICELIETYVHENC